MHAHKIDYTQAFIQGDYDKLSNGKFQTLYIRPPKGVEEDDDVVYQVMKQLYCIPDSARTLHFTIHNWLS